MSKNDTRGSKASGAVLIAVEWIYEKAVSGLGIDSSVEDMATDYAHRHTSTDSAIDSLIAWQVGKASVAGFATGLGGLITLPAAVPASLASVAYVQLRMVACIAYLRGYDIRSDQVKAMAFACLCSAQL